MKRHFLFLQGNSSGFFIKLGRALGASGHHVSRVNICGGDRLFWGDWRAVDYTDDRDGFAAFIAAYLDRHGVSDIILHNDCRPAHRAATAEARARGLKTWVFEEGYLRPHWLTMEQAGINGYSRLPDDPDWYRKTAKAIGELPPPETVGAANRGRIMEDFRWQWANYRQYYRYPKFKTHRPYPIWAEYATWAGRLSTWYPRHWQASQIVQRFTSGSLKYFVFPLQLDSDSQIRIHSPFKALLPVIERVIRDFATHAPGDCHLIVKNHPLDNGWINYRRRINKLARELDLQSRLHFIDGGDLNQLIDHARGTVTVNSTVGFSALDRGGAVICLGKAIFDIEGLTFPGGLSDFWTAAAAVDQALYNDFKKVVLDQCLINGNYYAPRGQDLAVNLALARFSAQRDYLATAPARGEAYLLRI